MTISLLPYRMTQALFRKPLFPAVALLLASLAGAPASSALAEDKQAVAATGKTEVDCSRLPAKEEFIKQKYDAGTIRIIQTCLAAKGYYKGPVDGKKGPSVIAALEKSNAADEALKKATGEADCTNLPSQETFIKGNYDKKSIEIIQGCLWEKGYYAGPVDGLKGPLTIAALRRLAQGCKIGPAPAIDGNGPLTSFRLTGKDFKELQTAENDIEESLNELKDEDYDSRKELKEAVESALQEVTDQYGQYRSAALMQAEQMKTLKLTKQNIEALQKAEVPDNFIGLLAELEDDKFTRKNEFIEAIKALLVDASSNLRTVVLKDVDDLKVFTLTDPFFKKLKTFDDILTKLRALQDVEYPNERLFVNALEAIIRDPMVQSGEIVDKGSFEIYEPVLLSMARKEHAFDDAKPVKWSAWSCGCYVGDFSGVVYGFYPFWTSGNEQKLDFSGLTRIGYFALTFDGNGDIVKRDWTPERADFIDKARQYRTNVDLIVYRNDWQNWPGFAAAKKTPFIEKLTSGIVASVTEKKSNTFKKRLLNRMKWMLSLGGAPVPSMADGVTIFFDGYPFDGKDGPSTEFFREFIQRLGAKLKFENEKLNKKFKTFSLNVVLPWDATDQLVNLREDVDLFLVLMEEPTTTTKKKLRLDVEFLFKGDERNKVLRKIVPVIRSRGHDYDKAMAKQLNDDLAYFQDNFGGVGFWPLPTSIDSGAAELNSEVRNAFSIKGDQDLQSKLRRIAPWFGRFVGPHRWGLRMAVDSLVFVLLVYAFFSCWIFELRKICTERFWWFFGVGALALLIQLSLFLGDPYWKDKTTETLFLLLLAVVIAAAWVYIGKMKQDNLP
jgi:peptidoglycan hydrolase-like protein with peptidoglycan-binding domain